jgi:electron transfer flavoprotein beta subunit
MNILVCVKRIPDTGARIEVTSDGKDIETKNLGFTISPHEECAVEEAVQIIEKFGGTATVLALGRPDAEEQLRDSIARGLDSGILLQTGGEEWDAIQTATAIVQAVRKKQLEGNRFDLILFGNESADCANYQVGIRVAHALDLPCVTGIKRLQVEHGRALASRDTPSGWETYEVVLPAVVTVKEGLNLPRHPSLRGTMTARKKPVDYSRPTREPVGLELLRLKLPEQKNQGAAMLGEGQGSIPGIIHLLDEIGLI